MLSSSDVQHFAACLSSIISFINNDVMVYVVMHSQKGKKKVKAEHLCSASS